MPDSASEGTPHEQLLDALIAEYLQAGDRGQPLDQEEFLRQHPEFAAELREFFMDAGQIEKFSLPPSPDPDETQQVNDSSSREQQLDAIIAEYIEAGDMGRPLDQADFISQHAEFAEELREFFADDVQIKKFAPLPSSDSDETKPVHDSSSIPRAPGTLVRYFGDYEILEELGVGGMGVVYKARQTKLNKIIALKMIKVGHLAGNDEVRRFQAEARAAAKLDHSGIVPVHEVGVDHGQHYYTMDYVGGVNLSKLHRDEPVAARRSAEIIKQMAEAMHYAHGQGIIHRDLKPGNVLLTTGGVPRITDFGLAKRLWSDDDSADVSMTETGQILGTAGYMSPEQAAGKNRLVGLSADIYALGAVLYALLTTRAPFVGESQADTILQVIQKEPVSPRALNPRIARDLETICLKCLEKEPHKRYGTAALLAEDLGRWLAGRPIVARPVGPAERAWLWCRRRPTLVLMSLLLVLVILGGTLLARERQNATRASAMVEALLVAPPQAVPYAIENLKPVQGHAVPILRQRLAEKSRVTWQRLRAAEALAHFGEVDVQFLVSVIPQASASEYANIAGALRGERSAAIAELKSQFEKTARLPERPDYRLGLVVVALQLGEVEPAKQVLALAPDPSERTQFIEQLQGLWGDRVVQAKLLRETNDPDFQSGLCLAMLGRYYKAKLTADERQALEAVLKHLYANSPHGSVRSAAKWTMQQWNLELPNPVAAVQAKPGQDWYVNPLGMNFLKIPAGSFEREEENSREDVYITRKKTTVTLSRAFWLGDCEVTRKHFEAFITDPDCLPAEKPDGLKTQHLFGDPGFTDDLPANSVNWFDAVLFCNWLSRREGLTPYYERTGEKQKVPEVEIDVWRSVPQSAGYRLPTEAEWEYACRAQSATNYCFGDEPSSLGLYAVFNTDKAEPVSSRRPNGWGLFDMYGNALEWNHDWYGQQAPNSGQPIVDPTGPSAGQYRVVRGGAFNEGFTKSYRFAWSGTRNKFLPPIRNRAVGFRVARTCP